MKLHFLAGLPRSGSTLLTSILAQNPALHAEGVSGLCDLMWSASQSVKRNQQWNGNPRNAEHIVRNLPSLYYSDISKPIVLDKCRAWTLPLNVDLIRDYITPTPKIVCCMRNIADVEQSFLKLFAVNGRTDFYDSPMFNELQMAVYGVQFAIESGNADDYLFIDYDNLIDSPDAIIKQVYDFLELDYFNHSFVDIVNACNEDDSVYGLVGMHDVRRSISRR